MLDERGETATEAGQRAVSILLLEDLAVVPLLALVVVLGTMSGGAVEGGRPVWLGLLIGLGCIAAVIAAYLASRRRHDRLVVAAGSTA